VYNNLVGFSSGLVASMFFGLADYLTADLTVRVGWRFQYNSAIITTFQWILYHIIAWIDLNASFKKAGTPTVSFFDKSTSPYYMLEGTDGRKTGRDQLEYEAHGGSATDSTHDLKITDANRMKGPELTQSITANTRAYVINKKSMRVPFQRMIMLYLTQGALFLCFKFADMSGTNTGIITSIFSMSLVFTAAWFFCTHGQKLTPFDMLGFAVILGCVIIISVSHPEVGSGMEIDLDNQTLNKVLAVFFALMCGLVFSIQSAEQHWTVVNTPFEPL